MRIAIRNLHRTGIGGKHPFHDYILGLIQSGVITHLYFEDVSFTDPALRAIRKRYRAHELGLDQVKLIFTAEELNRECDVLISFDSRLEDFSESVKNFHGLKIYHLMDYFWGEPLSKKIERLAAHGIDYVFSYGSPDRYCAYFKKYGGAYAGKVIPLPFGFGSRFTSTTPFSERLRRCIALGSVRPLRFTNEDPYKFEEQANAFAGEIWFHKFRRMLVEHKDELTDCMDSLLPEFPRYRDYNYDLPAKLNEYQAFVSDESLFYFPSAKAYEGPAAGSVMICSDHPCFSDFGFVDGVNCVTHKEFDIKDFHIKVCAALSNQPHLTTIASNGMDFVRSRYSHAQIGRSLALILTELYESYRTGNPVDDISSRAYDIYTQPPAFKARVSKLLRNQIFWYVVVGKLYCLIMDIYELPGQTGRKILHILSRSKNKYVQSIRSFKNREPHVDRTRRAAFHPSVKTLEAPTIGEEALIKKLREDFELLELPTNIGTAPERKWALFVAELRNKVLTEDPRDFLSWQVIGSNMGYRAGSKELSTLQSQKDWKRWEAALTEPSVTHRKPFYLLPAANENTIRQAFHLAEFKSTTGIDPTSYDTIVDFGGGYGSMCRLVYSLGFSGRYVIYDWKAFSLLQHFYLSLTESPLPFQANTLPELQRFMEKRRGKTLLIATWSLSEVSLELRNAIIDMVQPDGILISYQKEFGGVDNHAYFSSLKATRPDMRWHTLPMNYLATEKNRYLFGTHD